MTTNWKLLGTVWFDKRLSKYLSLFYISIFDYKNGHNLYSFLFSKVCIGKNENNLILFLFLLCFEFSLSFVQTFKTSKQNKNNVTFL